MIEMMNEAELLQARQNKRWEQIETAEKLGISQTYLSLLETGKRKITRKISLRAVKVFGLAPTALPIDCDLNENVAGRNKDLVKDLGTLGYPKFAHLKSDRKKNPLEVLFLALKTEDLESRVAEALPWLVFTYIELDWDYLLRLVKVNDLQNRLGFIVTLARKLAEKVKDKHKADVLREKETQLSKSRLYLEDAFNLKSLTETEKKWLQDNRSKEAKFWRVLSDLEVKHLDYGTS